jgi:8-oxo-dGTP pyrophosphatase MutT (NUDIX family)
VAKTQVAAYDKLDKADFDKLPDSTRAQIRSDLRTAKAKFLDPKKQAQVDAVLAKLNGPPGKPQDNGPSPATPKAPEPPKAPPAGVATPSTPSSTPSPAPTSAPTTPAAPVTKAHAHQQLIDDVHAADDHDVADRLVALRKAVGKDDPAYTKARDKVIDDTKRPLWLRSSLVPSRAGTDQRVASALAVAEHPPARGNGKLYITHYDAGDIFQPSDKDIAHLHPVQKEAIYHRRNEAIDVLTSGNVHDVSNDLAVAQGFNSTRDPQSGIFPIDKQKVSHLSPKARTGLEGALQRVAVERSGMLDVNQKSGFQSTLEDLQNVTHPPKVATALRVNRLRPYNDLDILDAGDDVTEADYKALPAAHQNMLLGNMTRVMRGGNTATIKRDARHRQMRWLGTYPKYSAASTNESVLAAGLDRTDLSPDDRLNQHLRSGVAGYNMLNGYDASLVKADIQGIADGNGTNTAGLQLNQRFDAQKLLDRIDSPRRGSQERDAISVAEPGFHDGKSVQARAQIYNALNAREFNALPKAYRDSILDDLENNVAHANLPVTGMADNLRARFDPKFAAQLKAANAAPTNPAIVPNMIGANQSDLKDALDVVYGLHPKAQHTSHQLATYGKLRKGQFDLLKPHEQQTILADLSFIETTSTRPSTKSKAKTLIHNFTPAGTAVGTTPPQAILPPATAVQGQTRVADPLGTPGTLKKSTNPGTGGDGWFRSPGGKTVWGKYGAAGLLLRHRGDDGVDRYLMVERGPAISDPGKWQFPGGAIDSKETFHEGAAREVIEELGFKDTDLIASRVHGEHTASVPGGWSYVSIAATTPTQLKPDLSTHHARAETSDAKWMTVDEIRKLDKNGKLLAPLANGALEKNVLSLFPASAPKATVARPGPVTKRAARLTGTPTVPVAPKPASPHKPSLGKDLVSDATTRDKLRQDVKAARVRFAGKTADDRLAAIGEIQGYDDTPSVVDKSTFDQLLATGNYIEAWRGVKGRGAAPRRGLGGAVSNTKTAEEINEEMRSGPAYYGKGVYGNGYYLAVSKSVAKGYSDGTKNSLVRVLIPKTAKIIKINDVQNQRSTHGINSRSKAKGSGGWDESTLWNEGRMAAALGKDGIQIDYSTGASHIAPTRSQPAFNWVNRGVLIVQEAE